MADVRKMSTDYLNTMNRLLTRHGFGPQLQGVHVDWDGLDRALKEHYREILRKEFEALQAQKDLSKIPTMKGRPKKTAGGDESEAAGEADSGK